MTEATLHNPPACPRNILDHGHGVTTTHESGMTLRDYFAGMAIGPLMAQPFFIMQACQKGAGEYAPDFADEAYEIADAMLKARQS